MMMKISLTSGGSKPDAPSESLAIPQSVRDEVDARDAFHCRFCGRHEENRAIHHCQFGGDDVGMGGRRLHVLENLITVGWTPGHDCHSIIHSNKDLWLPLTLEVVKHPGTTVLQLKRWRDRKMRTPTRYEPWTLIEATEAFWVRVNKTDTCWLWTGSNQDGYGTVNARAFQPPSWQGNGTRPMLVSRVAWFLVHGSWPREFVLHTCDVPACVNPAHLYEGDQAQNMQDRKERRPRFGAANPAARHADVVGEIRARWNAGETQASIRRDLGLSSAVVSRIARGVNYPERGTHD
jgi:hypothetical protein